MPEQKNGLTSPSSSLTNNALCVPAVGRDAGVLAMPDSREMFFPSPEAVRRCRAERTARPFVERLCRHCGKPWHKHSVENACILAPETDTTDLVLLGSQWEPMPAENLRPLIGAPEYCLTDFTTGRSADDLDRPVSRLERVRVQMDEEGRALVPMPFETKAVLCLIALAAVVAVVLFYAPTGRL